MTTDDSQVPGERELREALASKDARIERAHVEAAVAYVTYDGSAYDLNKFANYVTRLENAARAAIASHTAPVAVPVESGMREALEAVMRMADQCKEPCGSDPESAAAIRNGKFATIAQVAAQGLGLVRGPSFATPQPLPKASGAVAYRYKYTRGKWRYVGAPLTPCWDMPDGLNHEPLFAHAPTEAVCPACGAPSEVAGFVCVDCYYAEQRTGNLSTDYVKGFADGQSALAAHPQGAEGAESYNPEENYSTNMSANERAQLLPPTESTDTLPADKLAEVQKNAARYEWLRAQHEIDDEQASNTNYGKNYPPRTMTVFADDGEDGLDPVPCDPGALDAAIDEAMAERAGAESAGEFVSAVPMALYGTEQYLRGFNGGGADTKRADDWARLYTTANALVARIGYKGEISTGADEVDALMDALHDIDGGQWMPGLTPRHAQPEAAAMGAPEVALVSAPEASGCDCRWICKKGTVGCPRLAHAPAPGEAPSLTDGERAAYKLGRADEAVLALRAPTVPEGWKLVPVEPSAEMCAAATEQKEHDHRRGTFTVASNVYRAMLAAAPTVQAAQQEVGK